MDLVELEGGTQRHPWEVARSRFFLGVARRAGLLGPSTAILDVGAGDAWLAREWLAHGPARHATCWDSAYTPAILERLGLSHDPALSCVQDRPTGRFDLILLLDVLEHVQEDGPFLARLVSENLHPGGRALVSVPAWPGLFSSHDLRLRHARRYTPASARALLRGAGLVIERHGGAFHGLLLARALQVARERLLGPGADRGGAGGWRAPPSVTAVVTGLLSVDLLVSRALAGVGLALPGLSWWALCSKRR